MGDIIKFPAEGSKLGYKRVRKRKIAEDPGQLHLFPQVSAQILSFAMLLRYSLNMDRDAGIVESACLNVLASGLRTADIMSPGTAKVGTGVMGEAILRELEKVAA